MAIGRAAGLVDQRHMIADGLHEQHWMAFRCGSATMDLQWYIYNGVYAGWYIYICICIQCLADTYATNMLWADAVKAKRRKLQLYRCKWFAMVSMADSSVSRNFHGMDRKDSLHGVSLLCTWA